VRIGLFGGSFDPPHICHTLLCFYALEMTGIERILWVPCAEHPFGKAVAPFEHRLAMSQLAASALGPRVEVSDMEAHLEKPSYTVRTVEALRREMPDATIAILVGSDIVAELDKWNRIEDLRRMAEFVVIPRGECSTGGDGTEFVLPPLSSRAIRQALREGRSVERLIAPKVREYIERHGLYRG